MSAAVAMAAFNITTSFLESRGAKRAAKKAEKQRQKERAEDIAYQDPKNMRKRWEDAGFNPLLGVGQTAPANYGSPIVAPMSSGLANAAAGAIDAFNGSRSLEIQEARLQNENTRLAAQLEEMQLRPQYSGIYGSRSSSASGRSGDQNHITTVLGDGTPVGSLEPVIARSPDGFQYNQNVPTASHNQFVTPDGNLMPVTSIGEPEDIAFGYVATKLWDMNEKMKSGGPSIMRQIIPNLSTAFDKVEGFVNNFEDIAPSSGPLPPFMPSGPNSVYNRGNSTTLRGEFRPSFNFLFN